MKKACRKYGRPSVYHGFISTHGLSSHDFLNLEIRHHHAVEDTNVVIILFIFKFNCKSTLFLLNYKLFGEKF